MRRVERNRQDAGGSEDSARSRRVIARSWGRGFVALCLLALACVTSAHAQVGGIRGSVIEADFEVPVADVAVTVLELDQSTETTSDGLFVFDSIPPGEYTLTFNKAGYQRRVRSGVVVAPGQLADLRVLLELEYFEMDELVVTGIDLLASSEIGLLEIRQEALGLQDSISAELISKAGVSDVAGAVKLVTGVSVVDGKYATVRGLSDRYTGTTLNHVRVPSADPRRRAVQIDLFPTGTIDNVTVYKTFRPDLQGDFTGGGVDIQTRAIPEEPIYRVGVSTEYDGIATGEDQFLTYEGPGIEFFGVSGSEREKPAIADSELPTRPSPSFRPSEDSVERAFAFDRFTKAFSPTMGTMREAPGPNWGFSAIAGDRFETPSGSTIGLLGALTYSRKKSLYLDAANNNALADAISPVTISTRRTDSEGTEELLIGLLTTAAYRPNDDHEFQVRLIGNQSAEDSARFQITEQGLSQVERNQTLEYTERTVASLQFAGQNTFRTLFDVDAKAMSFSDLELDWTVASNYTRQYQPDVRFFRNAYTPVTGVATTVINSTFAQNTRRTFRDIDESNNQVMLDAKIPFTQWTETEGELKAGFYIERTEREYEQDSFSYDFVFQLGPFSNPVVARNRSYASGNLVESGADLWTDIFNDPERLGISDDRCALNENPFVNRDCAAADQLLWVLVPLGDDVNYTGDQDIDALYAMANFPLSARWSLVGGARLERTDISIIPVNPRFGTVETIVADDAGNRNIRVIPDEEGAAAIEDDSLLPALGVVWEMRDGMKLRANWGRTIARPTFRELAPIATEEFIAGDEFIGNPDLTLSKISNYDLRWEWFPRPGDVLAASVFYKELTDPIEIISLATTNRSFIQPLNYEKGEVRGFEIEGRTTLDTLFEGLSGWAVGMNYAFIDSSVEVPESERRSLAVFNLDEPERRLQGQPEFTANLNLTYDNDELGLSGGLFFNVVGETLITGAARGEDEGVPNVFEEQTENLDFRVNKKVGEHLSVSFRARNLLAPDRRSIYRARGSEAVKVERQTARRFSLSASYTW